MNSYDQQRDSSPDRSKQSHNPQQNKLGEQLSLSRIKSVHSCNKSNVKILKKLEMKLDLMLGSSPYQSSQSHASATSDDLKILYDKIQKCMKSVKKTVKLLNQRDRSVFQPIKRQPSFYMDMSISSRSYRNLNSEPKVENENTFSNQSRISLISLSLEYMIEDISQTLNCLEEKRLNLSALKLRNDQLVKQNQLLNQEKQQLVKQNQLLVKQYQQLLRQNQQLAKQYQQLVADKTHLSNTLDRLRQQKQNENNLKQRIKQLQKEIQQSKLQFYTLSEMSKKFTPKKKQSQSPCNLISSVGLKPLLALQYLPQKSEQDQSESNDRRLPRQVYHSTDSKSILPSDSSRLSILPYINPQLQYLKKRSSPYMKGTNTNYRITSRQNAHARSRVWNRLDTSKL